jgi:hypothetical protein
MAELSANGNPDKATFTTLSEDTWPFEKQPYKNHESPSIKTTSTHAIATGIWRRYV